MNELRYAIAKWQMYWFDMVCPEFNYWGYAREDMWKNQSILPNLGGISGW